MKSKYLPHLARTSLIHLLDRKGVSILDRLHFVAIELTIERTVSSLALILQKNNTISHVKPATIAAPKIKSPRIKPTIFINIPELLPSFPFSPRHTLPDNDALVQNIQWLTSFGFPVTPNYVHIYGEKYAMIIPKLDKKHGIMILNMMAVLAIVDSVTDDMCASDVERTRDVMENIMRDPSKKRSKREGKLDLLFQSFCQTAFKIGTSSFRRRFTDSWNEYMDSLLCKAQDRAYTHHRDVRSYIELRRSTIGLRPLYDLLFLQKDYPVFLTKYPKVMDLEQLALEMNALSQDICSYNQQQASNTAAHNIITLYQHENSCSLQEAFDYAAWRYTDASHQFVAALDGIPSHLEPLRWYFEEMGAMAVGIHDWSFIAPENRLGADVLKTRTFVVRPRER